MIWALVIITCADWNNCVTHKTYFNSLGECKAEYNFRKPMLANVELVPFAACIPQENQDEI